MKLRNLLVVMVLAGSVTALAQTQPNIENGFKAYGSYDGGDIDTIDLHNGNLILHIPMPFTYPQRGNLAPKNVLRLSSKSWAVVETVTPTGGLSMYWSLGAGPGVNIAQLGTGIGLSNSLDLSLHRLYQFESGTGASNGASTFNYYVTTWDGATHELHSPPDATLDATGAPTSYDAVDNSGFHVDLTAPDSYSGTYSVAIISDRHGNRYKADKWMTRCGSQVEGGFSTKLPGLPDWVSEAERKFEPNFYCGNLQQSGTPPPGPEQWGNLKFAPLLDDPTHRSWMTLLLLEVLPGA